MFYVEPTQSVVLYFIPTHLVVLYYVLVFVCNGADCRLLVLCLLTGYWDEVCLWGAYASHILHTFVSGMPCGCRCVCVTLSVCVLPGYFLIASYR